MKNVSRLVLVATLMVSIGGHWGVLQAIAWAGMLKDYTAEKGLVEGIVDTFNGERPCPLCKRIGELQHQEEKQNPAPVERADSASKWLNVTESTGIPLPAPMEGRSERHQTPLIQLSTQWTGAPPTPPPRGFTA